MDAEEKLLALKKAYADIILNISKEAAARVMTSERRAARYQHELKVAKEEALRMLMRLKQMMDSKTSEAEAAALNQQKKIEELEAQLQEAEDIVKDLREELGEVQAELERVKKDNPQNINEPNNTRIYSSQSIKFQHHNSQDEFAIAPEITMPYVSQQNEVCKCYCSQKVCTCSSYIRNRDLPSIILRDKDGLYRNGCTQRIRACERNLLDKELCLSGQTDKVKDKNDSEEQEEGEDTSKGPSSGTNTLTELENKLLADIKLMSFQPFHRKRKRATRRRKAVTHLSRKRTDLFQKPDQFPERSTRHAPVLVKENAHSMENPPRIAAILSPDKDETWTYRGCAESSGGRGLQKEEGLKEKIVPLGEETGFVESPRTPVCKVDVEKVDMPSDSLESNLSDMTKELSSLPVRERVIKYTFQRKRKRGALNGSEVNASAETDKKTDKKNGHKNLDASKSSLLVESSRDSRRLAQVARQLISLSEKKWWH